MRQERFSLGKSNTFYYFDRASHYTGRIVMNRKLSLIVIIMSLCVLPLGLFARGSQESSGTAEAAEAEKESLSVFVSILPQTYFVERIGGEAVEVQALVKPGQEPHTYEPTPSQVMALGEADILFTIGVEFEHSFVPEIESALLDLMVVHTQEGIPLREMEAHSHGEDHHHGEDHNEADEHHREDEHHHEGTDPHVWLSLKNGRVIARNMYNAMAKAAPQMADTFRNNLDELLADIDGMEEELRQILAPLKGGTFFVFHPAFGYFADDFGLVQEAVETGGKEPSPKQLQNITEAAKQENVRVIFVQPQFAKKSAQTVADAIGGAVVPLDPLAPDWLDNMKKIAESVGRDLGKQRSR